jgi:hypothetical protein
MLYILLLVVYLPLATWLFYLGCMHVDRVQRGMGIELHPVAAFVAQRILLPIGMLHNFAFNWLVMTVVFLDLPREFPTTARMNRYRQGPAGWRRKWAFTLCAVLLDPFDRRGIHT